LKGPAMKPVRVTNLRDFYTIFGEPVTGMGGASADIWRDGNTVNPGYAQFAAQAHLASETTPVTFVRLVGKESASRVATTGQAGWYIAKDGLETTADNSGGAYGLFIVQSASANSNPTGSLGAIFYTNPQQLEASNNFGGTDSKVFLGESFEQAILDNVGGGSATGDQFALVLPLQKGGDSSNNFAYHLSEARKARTGWFINRGHGSPSKLFRLIAHSEGEYVNKSISVQIADLKLGTTQNPDSSFTVRIIEDGNIVETYSGCNLNPSTKDYVGKRIGTAYQEWDAINFKWNTRGTYPNISNYVYAEIDDSIENQTLGDAKAIPVGFYGPLRHKGFSIVSGSTVPQVKADSPSISGADPDYYIEGASNIATKHTIAGSDDADHFVSGLGANLTASFEFASLRTTSINTNQGSNYPADSIFGIRHIQGNKKTKDASYVDLLRYYPVAPENDDGITISNEFERSFIFNLQEVTSSETTGTKLYYFSENLAEASQVPLQTLLNAGVRQYEAPMCGGFDGVNIFKTNPFSANLLGASRPASYVNETINFALDSISDKEVVEYDLLSMPGMTNAGITNRIIDICEDRGDALAIIDIEGIYEQKWENGGTKDNGSKTTIVTTAQTRNLDSSFAASYYPSIRLKDTVGGADNIVVVPPSVAAVGAIAKSQGLSEPWFAPAGFNRGGINQLGGTLGPRVVGTTEHLSKADRDDLYLENINPIARFPASGDIVIFGQKTLQQKSSALDRINVRRLLLYLKRKIGKVSETILFDQNVEATWKRFRAQADRILSDVQARLGIVEYKLVLDETTTTADLIDRNILYAKVMIKPARAIEYIVVDFVVTRSGIEL
jgi:hypothetical protein